MKKYILFISFAIVLISCGGNNEEGKVVFAPKEKAETIVTKGPSEQKDPMDPVAFEGCVKLMIMLPEGLPGGSEALLRNKMLSMTSINNVGAIDGNPVFVLVPTIEVINHDITVTVPAKHKVKYAMAIYVANLETGDVYGSVEDEVMGVGDSGELALSSAISGIEPAADKYQQMLKSAQERIIAYYNTNGDKFISEAMALANVNKYEEALTILKSIPLACTCYEKALEVKNEVMGKYLASNSAVLVAKMKAALASPRDSEEGYSKEFLALYTMLPPNSPSKAEADKLYADYQKSLDVAAAQIMAQKKLEWERQQQREKAQIVAEQENQRLEFEKYKIEMQSNAAIEGKTALLEKYK